MQNHQSYIIIAGEVSGDMHGARLMEEMLAFQPGLHFTGIGGQRMIEAGLDAKYHIRDMAFLGVGEVIRHLPFIRKVFQKIVATARIIEPAAVQH